MNYVARHRGKKTTCEMDSTGVLAGKAFKLFRGSIDLLPGGSGAKGQEQENVLLLGDGVVNQTIPLILCGEEDVEGNHGATIGRLDERCCSTSPAAAFLKKLPAACWPAPALRP